MIAPLGSLTTTRRVPVSVRCAAALLAVAKKQAIATHAKIALRITVNSRCSVVGIRYSVFGTRLSVLGSRYSVLGFRYSVFGIRLPKTEYRVPNTGYCH